MSEPDGKNRERSMPLENDPWNEPNPYEALDVPRDADRARIKAAYRAIQKRARRGDAAWTAAQVANESLTRPRKRLEVDLFVIAEKRQYLEIVRRYGGIAFDAVPKDPAPLLFRSTDLEWGKPSDDFAVPPTPPFVFSRLEEPPAESDAATVPFGTVARGQ